MGKPVIMQIFTEPQLHRPCLPRLGISHPSTTGSKDQGMEAVFSSFQLKDATWSGFSREGGRITLRSSASIPLAR